MSVNTKRLQAIQQNIKDTGYITEKDLRWVIQTVNREGYESVFKGENALSLPISLSPVQIKKGFDWLWAQYKTPTGKERKNNPFGCREEEILENFKTIEFSNLTNQGFHGSYYLPCYAVYDAEDDGFEYYVDGGKINITA